MDTDGNPVFLVNKIFPALGRSVYVGICDAKFSIALQCTEKSYISGNIAYNRVFLIKIFQN